MKITSRNNKKQRGNKNIYHIVEKTKNSLTRNTSSANNDNNKPNNFVVISDSI